MKPYAPLTGAQRQRLYRLKQRCEITEEMPWDIQYNLITNYKRKQRPKTGGVPQRIRRRLMVLFGLTPTQLLQYSEERQNEIMKQCLTIKDRRFKANRPKDDQQPK